MGADRYERTDHRRDYRSGHYERKLHTRSGEVTLKVPKLRKQMLDTEITERYRRRESSVEETLMEMYLAGVSVRRVEDITEALCGGRAYRRLSSATSTRRSISALAPSAGELVMHEIQRPSRIGFRLDEDRRPRSDSPATGAALPDGQSFLAIEPVDAVHA